MKILSLLTRSGKLKASIASSLVSKAVNLIFLGLIMPIVIKKMGENDYSVYTTLFYSYFWIYQITVAIGTTFSLQMTPLVSIDKTSKKESELLLNGALTYFSVILLFVFFIIFAIFSLSNSGYHLGFLTGSIKMNISFLIVIAIFSCSCFSDYIFSSRQEIYYNNVIIAIATFVSIFIFWSRNFNLSPLEALLFTYIPLALSKIIALYLTRKSHYDLICANSLNFNVIKILLKNSVVLLFPQISVIIYTTVAIKALETVSSTQSVVVYSAFITMNNLFGGLLLMYTQPLIPSLQESKIKSDFAWIRKSVLFTCKFVLPGLLIFSSCLYLSSPNLLYYYTGIINLNITPYVFCLWSVVFFLLALNHLLFIYSVSLFSPKRACCNDIGGSFVTFILYLTLAPVAGLAGVLISNIIGLCFTIIMNNPLKLRKFFA